MPISLEDCRIIELPKKADSRGILTYVESNKNLPFEIKNVFYIYDVPKDEERGSHAHKTLHEFLICLTGGFDVVLDNGFEKKTLHLDKAWEGLHIPPMIWGTEKNFSENTICLILTSDFYDPDDYYRDYDEFLRSVKNNK